MPHWQLARRPLAVEALEDRRLLAGNPTADEQHLLQLINRFRTDPQGEFARLMVSTSPLVARDATLQLDLDYAQVNGPALQSQLANLTPLPPLAWNAAASEFAARHNATMIGSTPPQQFHSNTLQRRQALLDAGIPLRFQAGEKIHAENVYGYGKSVGHTYAAWVVDWLRGAPNGMQSGHRAAIMNGDYDQLGHSITPYPGSNFGPLVTTQVLVNVEAPPTMVVGAVFQDRNASGWYEAGEGLGQVQIVFRGAAGTFSTTALAAGGYQIALPPGTYTATATGGGMQHPVVASQIQVGADNVWRNQIYDPALPPPLPPVAELDRATVTSQQPHTSLQVTANDRDPDGPAAALVPELLSGSAAGFTVVGSRVDFTAPPTVSGVVRARYVVRDAQGLVSAPADIEVFVADFSQPRPWSNRDLATDVNDDNLTTPLDALLIVNELNLGGSRSLPGSASPATQMFGFLDTSGDGFLSAIDVLQVINRLNAASSMGVAEAEMPPEDGMSHDLALAALYADGLFHDSTADLRRRSPIHLAPRLPPSLSYTLLTGTKL